MGSDQPKAKGDITESNCPRAALFSLGSTMAVRLFCKQGVVGSTPSQGSILDRTLITCIKLTYA